MNRPCPFQFLHTVSAQYTGQVPSVVKNEGLWLSSHGRLPGTLRYVYVCMVALDLASGTMITLGYGYHVFLHVM